MRLERPDPLRDFDGQLFMQINDVCPDDTVGFLADALPDYVTDLMITNRLPIILDLSCLLIELPILAVE